MGLLKQKKYGVIANGFIPREETACPVIPEAPSMKAATTIRLQENFKAKNKLKLIEQEVKASIYNLIVANVAFKATPLDEEAKTTTLYEETKQITKKFTANFPVPVNTPFMKKVAVHCNDLTEHIARKVDVHEEYDTDMIEYYLEEGLRESEDLLFVLNEMADIIKNRTVDAYKLMKLRYKTINEKTDAITESIDVPLADKDIAKARIIKEYTAAKNLSPLERLYKKNFAFSQVVLSENCHDNKAVMAESVAQYTFLETMNTLNIIPMDDINVIDNVFCAYEMRNFK